MKQPDIKFEYNQNVWINGLSKAKTFCCKSVKVLCTYNGYSANEWGETTDGSAGLPYRIFYSEVANPSEVQWTSQEFLFATKQELLDSL